jgi:hypothetical protein
MLHRIRALAIAVSMMAVQSAHAIDPWNIWLKRTPLPEENELNSITYGNGRYVVVGNKGVILTSTNATNWRTVRKESDMLLSVARFGNGIFVSGGWADDYYRTNVLLISSNGLDWNSVPVSQVGDIFGMAFGNGRFVINMEEDAPALISTNGSTWISGEPIYHDIEQVAFGNGRFAAADFQHFVFSTNGVNWESQNAPFNGTRLVSYLNDRFVLAGVVHEPGSTDPNFALSTDGTNWTTAVIPMPSGSFGGTVTVVAYMQGRYLVYGTLNGPLTGNQLRPAVWHSTDAGQHWQVKALMSLSSSPSEILCESDRLIAVGAAGEIAISSDGLEWTKVHQKNPQPPYNIAYLNGRFIATCRNGGIASSDDGVLWATQTVQPTNTTWLAAAYGADCYVAVGYRSGGAGAIASSTDGTNWTSQAVSDSLSDVAFGNGRFVAVGVGFANFNSYQVFVSSNGFTWNVPVSGTGFSLYSVTYANGKFVAVGTMGRVLTSADGLTWSEVTTDPLTSFHAIAFGNSNYVAVGARQAMDLTYSIPVVYYSGNGTNWTAGTITATNTANNTNFDLACVTFGNGTFVAGAAYAPTIYSRGGMLFSSLDGKVWQQRFTLPLEIQMEDFTGVASGRGTFVAVGPTGVTYQTPDIAARFRAARSGGNVAPEVWLEGYSNALYAIESSTNLVQWRRDATNRLTGSPMLLPASTNSSRFFRAVFLPD